MEANRKRNIKSGKEYDHLFPEAAGNNATIRKNANVYHTVAFIPKVVNETLYQTKALANQLNRNNIYETCKNIWHFVYQHINYKKDAPGYEQIRSPARAWHDRFTGVDCDCYSVFISSILYNLGIPHILRITKYHRDYFQHIYPVVPFQNGFITIDCVTDQFNYEVPFSEKKDYPMDLQYLNGFEDDDVMNGSGDGMAELGRLLKKRMVQSSKKAAKPATVKKLLPGFLKKKKLSSAVPANTAADSGVPDGSPKPKKKKFLGKLLNVVNKVNPATVLLRNGILASMKLNIRNVAARLRWSYLTPQQASAKSIEPAKFQKLLNARMKLEKIFFGAGGNPKNLKKAILSGKGNKDKAVNGFDGFGMFELEGVQYMNEYTSMPELLGTEIYEDENVNGMEGFGELGEPITLSSIAAAAGVIAGIVAMLKDVGNIFQKKTKDAEDFDETKNEEADKNAPVPPQTATPSILPTALPTVITKENVDVTENAVKTIAPPADEPSNAVAIKSTPETIPAEIKNEVAPATTATNNAATNENTDNASDNPGFWEKNKKWLKPVAIGVGGLTIIGIGYSLMKAGKTQNKSSPTAKGLSGTPRSKKRKNQQRKKTKHHKKKAIALL
ncbi:hypothetical protein [Ferruginibacter sp.]|nr:hypothetical protein [Ferruginibacter sp.]